MDTSCCHFDMGDFPYMEDGDCRITRRIKPSELLDINLEPILGPNSKRVIVELFAVCISRNSIVHLPNGLGKTSLYRCVAACMNQLNKQKKSLILVDNVNQAERLLEHYSASGFRPIVLDKIEIESKKTTIQSPNEAPNSSAESPPSMDSSSAQTSQMLPSCPTETNFLSSDFSSSNLVISTTFTFIDFVNRNLIQIVRFSCVIIDNFVLEGSKLQNSLFNLLNQTDNFLYKPLIMAFVQSSTLMSLQVPFDSFLKEAIKRHRLCPATPIFTRKEITSRNSMLEYNLENFIENNLYKKAEAVASLAKSSIENSSLLLVFVDSIEEIRLLQTELLNLLDDSLNILNVDKPAPFPHLPQPPSLVVFTLRLNFISWLPSVPKRSIVILYNSINILDDFVSCRSVLRSPISLVLFTDFERNKRKIEFYLENELRLGYALSQSIVLNKFLHFSDFLVIQQLLGKYGSLVDEAVQEEIFEEQEHLVSIYSRNSILPSNIAENLSTSIISVHYYSKKRSEYTGLRLLAELKVKFSFNCKKELINSLMDKLNCSESSFNHPNSTAPCCQEFFVSVKRLDSKKNLNQQMSFSFKMASISVGNLQTIAIFNAANQLTDKAEMKMEWNFEWKRLSIYILDDYKSLYKLELDFYGLERLVLYDLSKQHFVFCCRTVPYIFKCDNFTKSLDSNFNEKMLKWSRVPAVPQLPLLNESYGYSVFLDNIGSKQLLFLDFLDLLSNLSFKVKFGPIILNYPSEYLSLNQLQTCLKKRSFELDYLLECFLSECSRIVFYRVSMNFVEMLNSLSDEHFERVIYSASELLAKCRFNDVQNVIQNEIARKRYFGGSSLNSEVSSATSLNSSASFIKFVVATPTRIICFPPKLIKSNRVLRKYNPNHFIRMLFRDENLGQLQSTRSHTADLSAALKVFYKILRDGLRIAGEYFEFLAMSNSQLRDHNCWFFRPYSLLETIPIENSNYANWTADSAVSTFPSQNNLNLGDKITAETIRSWLGNFEHIKCIGKYVARLGQSLSSSSDTVIFDDFLLIPDKTVKSKLNEIEVEYTFTDGIGKVSFEKAREIAKMLHLEFIPSAFQIRYGGCKGVVAIDPCLIVSSKAQEGSEIRENEENQPGGRQAAFEEFKENYQGIKNGIDYGKYRLNGAVRFTTVKKNNLKIRNWKRQKNEEEEADSSLIVPKFPSKEAHRFPPCSYHLHIRPSMLKFDSSYKSLDVINYALPIPCFLNRQVILLLSALGIQDEIFINLQNEMLMNMADFLLSESAAFNEILSIYSGAASKYQIALHKSLLVNDPHFTKILQIIYLKKLSAILTKSKIFVEKGRILMGTIDETGTLKENQVFIKISLDLIRRNNTKFQVIVDKVAVAKNPCMHPGDVRVLQAVDNPLLHHMIDVIVFPAVGDRPVTSMCSGSDLDGDLYFATWDQRLVPQNSATPMEYVPVKAMEQNRPITINDIQEFFINFMINDQMGVIANCHVALADSSPLGACDPKCIKLAELFSMAVDFPKTGVVAVLPNEMLVQKYPDFMMKPARITYQSEKVIGKLFRKCKLIFDLPFKNVDVKLDPSLVLCGYEEYMAEARNLYRKYKSDIQKLMKLYDIESEYELLLGESNLLGYGKKEEEKDQLIVACGIFKEIRQSLRKEFFKPFEAEIQFSSSMQYEVDDDDLFAMVDENVEQYSQSYATVTGHFDYGSGSLGLGLFSNESGPYLKVDLDRFVKLKRKASAWYVAAYEAIIDLDENNLNDALNIEQDDEFSDIATIPGCAERTLSFGWIMDDILLSKVPESDVSDDQADSRIDSLQLLHRRASESLDPILPLKKISKSLIMYFKRHFSSRIIQRNSPLFDLKFKLLDKLLPSIFEQEWHSLVTSMALYADFAVEIMVDFSLKNELTLEIWLMEMTITKQQIIENINEICKRFFGECKLDNEVIQSKEWTMRIIINVKEAASYKANLNTTESTLDTANHVPYKSAETVTTSHNIELVKSFVFKYPYLHYFTFYLFKWYQSTMKSSRVFKSKSFTFEKLMQMFVEYLINFQIVSDMSNSNYPIADNSCNECSCSLASSLSERQNCVKHYSAIKRMLDGCSTNEWKLIVQELFDSSIIFESHLDSSILLNFFKNLAFNLKMFSFCSSEKRIKNEEEISNRNSDTRSAVINDASDESFAYLAADFLRKADKTFECQFESALEEKALVAFHGLVQKCDCELFIDWIQKNNH